jgi:hypothetical protein
MSLPKLKDFGPNKEPSIGVANLASKVGVGVLDTFGLLAPGVSNQQQMNSSDGVRPVSTRNTPFEQLLTRAVSLLSAIYQSVNSQTALQKQQIAATVRSNREDRLEGRGSNDNVEVVANMKERKSDEDSLNPMTMLMMVFTPEKLAAIGAALGAAAGPLLAGAIIAAIGYQKKNTPVDTPEWMGDDLQKVVDRMDREIYDVTGGAIGSTKEAQAARDKGVKQKPTDTRLNRPVDLPGKPGAAQGVVDAIDQRISGATGGAFGSTEEAQQTRDQRSAVSELKERLFKSESAGGNPNIINHGKKPIKHKDLSKMSIAEVIAYSEKVDMEDGRKGGGSSTGAAGLYQIVPWTLKDLMAGRHGKPPKGINMGSKFTKETQDKLFESLLQFRLDRAKKKGYTADAIAEELAKEWSSLPAPSKGGKSYYAGDKALHSLKDIRELAGRLANEPQAVAAPTTKDIAPRKAPAKPAPKPTSTNKTTAAQPAAKQTTRSVPRASKDYKAEYSWYWGAKLG